MSFIQTHSGASINLVNINTDLISIDDIAHALAHINRFSGHSLRPISVAEHSLMVAMICERHFQVSCPAGLLAALMHDAHEALIGDITSPVKAMLGDTWRAFETRVQRTVLRKWGLLNAYASNQIDIRNADLHALTSEREQLMADGEWWDCQATHPAIDWVQYGPQAAFTPADWAQAFKDRFDELQHALALRQEELYGA